MRRPSSKPEKRKQKSPVKVVAEPKVTDEELVPSGQAEILCTDVLGQEETDETVEQVKEEPEDVTEGCFNIPAVQEVEHWWLFLILCKYKS